MDTTGNCNKSNIFTNYNQIIEKLVKNRCKWYDTNGINRKEDKTWMY